MLIVFDYAINILTPAIITYSFKASTTQVTLLHFVTLVYMMFPIKVNFATPSNSVPITSTNPIWKLRSLLLAKNSLTKT